MAFLTLGSYPKENRDNLTALVREVYEKGSGTRHVENKEWGKKGHRIVSVYGGGYNRQENIDRAAKMKEKGVPWPLAISVEFGQYDFKKVYVPKDFTHYKNGNLCDWTQDELVDEIVNDMFAWLFADEVKVGDWIHRTINQGTRACEVVKIGRTRARIEYEMPNAGMMGGYMPILNLFGRKLYAN